MLDKAYEPKPVEAKWLAAWRRARLFASAPAGEKAKRFVVVIPPPNVTGALHLGHALNNTIQDVLVRWHRLHGAEACWVPGTDHGGIATQNVMEKQLKAEKLTRHELGREKFLQRMQAWTRDCKKTILGQLERLGCALDWDREAFTMDEPRAQAVFHTFRTLWEKGLIYRGERMVNWCVRCGTALSDIEVEHEERKGHLWSIHYPLPDGSHGIEVATTRPETLLGDTAVAVHPKDERYAKLVGRKVKLPLLGVEIPVVADDQVDSSFGTGAVKVTPAHDVNDYEIWQRHQAQMGAPRRVIGHDGKLTPLAGPYAGLSREQGREKIVEDLKASALLRKVDEHRHAVGVCYRCSSIIEPLLSEQWWVRMAPLAARAARAVPDGEFRISPASWTKPYLEWLSGIKDWCISRQIWWGHRIPVWYCADCQGENLVATYAGHDGMLCTGSVALLLKDGVAFDKIETLSTYEYRSSATAAGRIKGVEVSLARPGSCAGCGGHRWLQDQDVLDTWFSSALWPMSVFGWPEKTKDLEFYYPTSVLVTGYEILYLWVARMQMMGLEFLGRAPFPDALIHGIVRDKSGKKMSKSLGNVIDPLEMMDKFGTDALRFSLMVQAHPGKDIPFAEDSITGSRNFANKIWNSSRFVLMNLPASPDRPYRPVEPGGLTELADRWILSRYQTVIGGARELMAAFDPAGAADLLYGFLWDEFCDWYVELVKARLQGPDGEDKETARAILVEILNGTLKMLHPFMPYITEELFAALKPYSGESADFILKAVAPEPRQAWADRRAHQDMSLLMQAIIAIRSLRAQLNVPPALKIRVIGSGGSEPTRALLSRHAAYLKTLARIEEIEFSASADRPPHSATAVAAGLSLFIPLEGVVDFAQERDRLTKEMGKVEAEIRKISQKVGNKDFLARAPESEVSLARAQHEAALAKQARLKETLSILS